MAGSRSAERIKQIRKKYGFTQLELANIAGVTENAVSKWENGYADPRVEAAEKIAAVCEETTGWILGLSDTDSELLMPGFEPKIRGARPVKGMEMGYVPLRGRVHMGTPTEPEVYEEEMVLAPQFLIDDDPDLYACTSEGDCMNRVYPEGCIIFVSPNKEPQNGSVAVVTIDGTETVMRRMFRTASTLVLSPDSFNPENKDIVITSDDERTVEYGGKVVWFQANGEME